MPQVDPRLDDAALGALAGALAGAFDSDDLFEAVLVDLDQDLYANIAERGTPIQDITPALVQWLKRRGWILRFMRAARRRRPDNGSLIAVIRQHCPAALQSGPPAADEVTVLIDALALVRARLVDPGVASAVEASSGDLRSLAAGLSRLRVYKGLHDVLQKCQVSQFALLTDNVRRLRIDPQASVSLRDLLLDLKMTFDNARKGLRPLEASHDDVEERSWIDNILAAVAKIGRARDLLDDRAARIAVHRIRDLLQSQPSRINGLLRTEARKLPLTTLSTAVAAAAAAAGLSVPQHDALASGVASLTELRLRLARSVADHDRWQLVERQLWFIDGLIERDLSAMAELDEYWQVVKESIQPLWTADLKADWVVSTQDSCKLIDAVLAALPLDLQRVRNVYGDFRSAALWQFYDVDGELRSLCEDVLAIAAPVMALTERNG